MKIKANHIFIYTSLFRCISAKAPTFPDCSDGPLSKTLVCDASADPLVRASALVALLTVEEKLMNTGSASPEVPRLGLPPYNWGNEVLHGVARSRGVHFADSGDFSTATSFPQPILLGATFDDELVRDVADVISTEARAFSNDGRAALDAWTPNINPFRDPRWGRGQETPGEDPFHLSSYVGAYVEGLQGGHRPKVKKLAATCKHFVAYDIENWNGNERLHFDARINSQDLVEYYMPPFKACARDSNVGGFMCSYNALNGVPTCADPWLLTDVLRDHWNWTDEQQWVASDCGAVAGIFLPHNFTDTREEAVAASLNAGLDIDCGTYFPHHLPAALAQGLIEESTLDQSLLRQYSSLVRLGYFDGPEAPYRNLTADNVNTPYAQKLALRAAQEGITLLKNDGLLPLDVTSSPASDTKIAVIGSWANATVQMQGNYFGTAPYLRSPLQAAQELRLDVKYARGDLGPATDGWDITWEAANASDVIVFVSGIDHAVEKEEMDRVLIGWTGAQLDLIGELAGYGKPMIVVQMGAGQIDSSPIVSNPNISALLWGGYPGQDGGTALFDIITGKVPPAGRLPVTQYPAIYASQMDMTDMSLRPSLTSPGRTYKWYNGTPTFEFGHGLHYTNFTAAFDKRSGPSSAPYQIQDLVEACQEGYKDQCPFESLAVVVENTGAVPSDYVALAFLTGSFGPEPYPKKSLVAYQRLHEIGAGAHAVAQLNLTLGSLARVDDEGNTVLYPGHYTLMVDTQPLATVDFTLEGEPFILDQWPQPPPPQKQRGDYFVGGQSRGSSSSSSTSTSSWKARLDEYWGEL